MWTTADSKSAVLEPPIVCCIAARVVISGSFYHSLKEDLTPKSVDRITSMDLKARFEKMKLYLIIGASEDERKHWLAGGGIQHDNSLNATTNA